MQKKGAEIVLRDLNAARLTAVELDNLIGNGDYKQFLNPRNELYRKMKMAERPPSREVAIKLMAAEPNLIRRPVVIRGRQIVLGYDEDALEKLVS